ncbi:hypothetical protein [Blastococcus xanthinilyticus]|uniref:DUF5642 domain-containing protein n=1 Tax=Blastococcus xanthinilyticus TaxID=1564164 RepID=A0A5S5CZD9_9ACTN|nr:hypothetical protein [Blastococcus xanthinilyticus]TYP88454.1 hypothetical protein BD833_104158 [Blastococcus xanthinilyticus]
MRHLLAGVTSLLFLAGCASTAGDPAAVGAPPAPQVADVGALADQVATGRTAGCENPAGFEVVYPADWSVNSGAVVPPCSWFDAAAFTVPEASDVRTAAITFAVRPADEMVQPWPDVTASDAVDVGGRTAVRVEQVSGPGLYPVGTPITSYVVDLPSGEVLVASTVGLPGSDHERDVAVLDAMMDSLRFAAAPLV